MAITIFKWFSKKRGQNTMLLEWPLLYLYSDEYFHLLREPIQCIPKKKISIQYKQMLLVEVFPTLCGMDLGVGLIDVKYLLLKARYGNLSVINLNKYPIDVLVYLPKNQNDLSNENTSLKKMLCVAWATLDIKNNFVGDSRCLVENKLQQEIVLNDWLSYFTELKRIDSGNIFFKRIGPFLVGIELWSSPEGYYQVLFVLKNLMNSDGLKEDFEFPLCDGGGKGKNCPIVIDYNSHKSQYLRACQIVEKENLINLKGDVLLDDMLEILISKAKQYTYLTIELCYILIQFSFLLNSQLEQEKLRGIVLSIIDDYGRKNPIMLDNVLGVDVTSWIIYAQSLDQNKIIEAINMNIERYKVANWKDYLKW